MLEIGLRGHSEYDVMVKARVGEGGREGSNCYDGYPSEIALSKTARTATTNYYTNETLAKS